MFLPMCVCEKELIFKMGKTGRKRKKDVNTSGDPSDVSTGRGDTSMFSSVLSAANRVLYGALSGSPTTEPSGSNCDGPRTSTPRKECTDTALTNEDISAQLTETNQKLDTILDKLSKLDILEKKISDVEVSVGSIDERVKAVESKSREFE